MSPGCPPACVSTPDPPKNHMMAPSPQGRYRGGSGHGHGHVAMQMTCVGDSGGMYSTAQIGKRALSPQTAHSSSQLKCFCTTQGSCLDLTESCCSMMGISWLDSPSQISKMRSSIHTPSVSGSSRADFFDICTPPAVDSRLPFLRENPPAAASRAYNGHTVTMGCIQPHAGPCSMADQAGPVL